MLQQDDKLLSAVERVERILFRIFLLILFVVEASKFLIHLIWG